VHDAGWLSWRGVAGKSRDHSQGLLRPCRLAIVFENIWTTVHTVSISRCPYSLSFTSLLHLCSYVLRCYRLRSAFNLILLVTHSSALLSLEAAPLSSTKGYTNNPSQERHCWNFYTSISAPQFLSL